MNSTHKNTMVHIPDHVENKRSSIKRKDYQSYIEHFMNDKKPYLKPCFTLQEMAIMTGINLPALSAFINQAYQMNFNEFVNMYRVNYFKSLLELPEYHQWTLEAIAYKAGFNSRTTFIRSFTRCCGCTPREYFKLMRVHNKCNCCP